MLFASLWLSRLYLSLLFDARRRAFAMRWFFLLLFIISTSCTVFAAGDWQIIKARGDYGIANKGVNQGVRVGQVLELHRMVASDAVIIGKVKVIRATANRAAVEKIALEEGLQMVVGDILVLPAENPLTVPEPVVTQESLPSHQSDMQPVTKDPAPLPEPPQQVTSVPEYRKKYENQAEYKPWVSIHTGATIPGGGFASNYGTSPVLGASYMVPLQSDLNIGLEINQSFMNNNSSSTVAAGTTNELSSSILEGLIVCQKFFGDYFFMEAGGGLYRPKVTIASLDGTKSSFTSTDFGLFGGTGLFVPTSSDAGFALRARLHNYFDQNSRTYLGLSGGFRFRMR
jgi:hypothetical protein